MRPILAADLRPAPYRYVLIFLFFSAFFLFFFLDNVLISGHLQPNKVTDAPLECHPPGQLTMKRA
jgi:hypothetical protein